MATWNDNIPDIANQVASDIPDIRENLEELHDVIEAITNGTLGSTEPANFKVDVLDTGVVDTAQLAADCVTGAKIADDQIDSEHYVAGSIDNEHLADNAVDTEELANDAVTAAKIAGLTATIGEINTVADGSTAKNSHVHHQNMQLCYVWFGEDVTHSSWTDDVIYSMLSDVASIGKIKVRLPDGYTEIRAKIQYSLGGSYRFQWRIDVDGNNGDWEDETDNNVDHGWSSGYSAVSGLTTNQEVDIELEVRSPDGNSSDEFTIHAVSIYARH